MADQAVMAMFGKVRVTKPGVLAHTLAAVHKRGVCVRSAQPEAPQVGGNIDALCRSVAASRIAHNTHLGLNPQTQGLDAANPAVEAALESGITEIAKNLLVSDPELAEQLKCVWWLLRGGRGRACMVLHRCA